MLNEVQATAFTLIPSNSTKPSACSLRKALFDHKVMMLGTSAALYIFAPKKCV